MKRAFVIFIAILFFIVATIVPVYAQEIPLATRRGNVTKQEDLSNLINRLTREALEEAKKDPCMLKALKASEAGIRVMFEDDGATVVIIAKQGCD